MTTFDQLRETVESWAQVIGPNVYLQAIVIAFSFVLIAKLTDFFFGKIVIRIAKRSKTIFDDELVSLFHRPVFVSVILVGLALATSRLDTPDTVHFITLGILKTIAIFIWLGLLQDVLHVLIAVINRSTDTELAWRRMLPLVDNISKVALIAIAIYFLFLAWQIDVTAWLASAGIVGLALSFAAKDTLSNLFAGVSILADAPYKVGNFIILESGERGMVTHIGFRSTRIMTRDDVEITIPNGIIGNGKIINEAGGSTEKHRIRAAVGVAYGSDLDHVMSVLTKVAASLEEICVTPEPRVRFRAFGESSLDFELLCWIDRPVDRGRLIHELNCAIYRAFNEAQITIPFPQRDLYVKGLPEQIRISGKIP